MAEPVFKKFYKEQVVPELSKSKGYKNLHQVPTIEKIVINSGVSASLDRAAVNETAKEIGMITGQ